MRIDHKMQQQQVLNRQNCKQNIEGDGENLKQANRQVDPISRSSFSRSSSSSSSSSLNSLSSKNIKSKLDLGLSTSNKEKKCPDSILGRVILDESTSDWHSKRQLAKSQDRIDYNHKNFDEQLGAVRNSKGPLSTFDTELHKMATKQPNDDPNSPNKTISNEQTTDNRVASGDDDSDEGPSIANLTGPFGHFQLFLAALVFVRYCSLALMTSSGPLLAPEIEFRCLVPDEISARIDLPQNETMNHFMTNRCSVPLGNGTAAWKCDKFWFNRTLSGITMTESMELVCDRAYLKSTFQSAISIGVVMACILSGPISDQHGRLFVIRSCYLWSLFWGCVSYFVKSFQVFTIARAFVTFGDSSLVGSLSLVVIELVQPKIRGMILILVYTGWSLGVMFMPFVCDFLMDFKAATLFTVIVHLVTLAPLLLVQESVRWSMVMGYFNSARQELERIHRWNRRRPENFDQDFKEAMQSYKTTIAQSVVEGATQDSGDQGGIYIVDKFKSLFKGIWQSYKRIGEFFQSWKLALTTLVIVWISINGELFYMLFILINSDVGEAKLANYMIGFAMELLATLVGILMTSYMSRRLSILITMMFISFNCVILSLTYEMTVISVIVMNLAKLAISNLTSLSWVLANESFPTTLRQTGSGITGSIGSFGAVAAPFVRTELTQKFGFGTVMFTLGTIVFFSSWVSFLVKETKDTELPDNLAQMTEIAADNNGPFSIEDGVHPNTPNTVVIASS